MVRTIAVSLGKFWVGRERGRECEDGFFYLFGMEENNFGGNVIFYKL